MALSPDELRARFRAARTGHALNLLRLQLYRLSCGETEHHASRLGMPGWPDTSLAVYHEGSDVASATVACQQQLGRELGLGTLVFKWKNPETALRPLWRHQLSSGPQMPLPGRFGSLASNLITLSALKEVLRP